MQSLMTAPGEGNSMSGLMEAGIRFNEMKQQPFPKPMDHENGHRDQ